MEITFQGVLSMLQRPNFPALRGSQLDHCPIRTPFVISQTLVSILELLLLVLFLVKSILELVIPLESIIFMFGKFLI